jgi:hypothetical protein
MSESIQQMLAREAAEAEARADAEERGEIAPAGGQRGRRRAADPSQVYAVRIPVSKLRKLRELAERLDVPPTALIRRWVIERLDEVDVDDHTDRDDVPQVPEPVSGLKLGPSRRRVIAYPTDQAYNEQVRRYA